MSTMAFAEKLVTILPGFSTCKFLFTSDNLLLLKVDLPDKIYKHLIYPIIIVGTLVSPGQEKPS